MSRRERWIATAISAALCAYLIVLDAWRAWNRLVHPIARHYLVSNVPETAGKVLGLQAQEL